MSSIDFTLKIGGEAGFGIASSGIIFAKTLNRLNYHTYGYLEYPSLIRGGHNVYEVHVADEKVYSQESKVDILICLNKETFELHKDELKSGAVVVFDGDKTKIDEAGDYHLYSASVAKMTKDLGGSQVMENNVFLGIALALMQADQKAILEVVADIFAKKGEKIINKNHELIKAGYDYVKDNLLPDFKLELTKQEKKDDLVMTGNEAVSLGAIAADCRLYAAYPMTPASSILHVMAAYSDQSKMVVKHVGDEIEAINLIIGSAYAGIRAMTGTSGGGFALMNEGLGLAGITESSLVIVESQRPGPATGVPTWTGQGDLQYLIHASQDEFPRIILAPGDPLEIYLLAQKAFNLADIYQTPVFILLDKYLSEGLSSVSRLRMQKMAIERGKLMKEGKLKKGFVRYEVTKDGISPRSIVGQKNGEFMANSYEHNEYGLSTEDSAEIIAQRDKRIRKMDTYLDNHFEEPKHFGNEEAELTLISWGSTKASVLEAMRKMDKRVNYLHFNHVYPLDKEVISSLLNKTKKSLLLEGNSQGQFGMLLREQTGWQPTETFLRYDGRPFYPEEIREKVKEMLDN